jgi:hypothetical protein
MIYVDTSKQVDDHLKVFANESFSGFKSEWTLALARQQPDVL